MGARYSVSRQAALSTTADHFTLQVPATRAAKIWAIRVGGAGTTSGYNEVLIARSTGGVTPGAAITPTPKATLSAAAGSSAPTTWGTQPTIGVTVQRVPINSNGAINNVTFLPGNEIDIPPSGQISVRSASGTAAVSVEIEFEEVG